MTGWANNERALIALANGLFLCAAYTYAAAVVANNRSGRTVGKIFPRAEEITFDATVPWHVV